MYRCCSGNEVYTTPVWGWQQILHGAQREELHLCLLTCPQEVWCLFEEHEGWKQEHPPEPRTMAHRDSTWHLLPYNITQPGKDTKGEKIYRARYRWWARKVASPQQHCQHGHGSHGSTEHKSIGQSTIVNSGCLKERLWKKETQHCSRISNSFTQSSRGGLTFLAGLVAIPNPRLPRSSFVARNTTQISLIHLMFSLALPSWWVLSCWWSHFGLECLREEELKTVFFTGKCRKLFHPC